MPNVVLAPVETLVRHTLADDAFYYFVLARHFPTPAFDAGVRTTGFHPLYWVLIGPVFRLVGGSAPIRFALLLLLAAHVGTGLVMWRVVRRHVGPGPAVAAAVWWMVDPHVRALALLGVETSLATLGVMALVWAVDASPATRRHALAVGSLVGLTFLARTDSVIVTVPIAAAWLVKSTRAIQCRRLVPTLGLSASVAAAIACPWISYLVAHGAVAAQDSQVAERLLSARRGVTWSFLAPVWHYVSGHLSYALVPWVEPGRLSPSIVDLVGITAVLATALAAAGCAGARRWLGLVAPCAGGTVALFVAYALVLHHLSAWYVLYACLATWLTVVVPVIALIAGRLGSRRWPLSLRAVSLLAAVGAVMAVGWTKQQDFEPGQLDKYRAVAAAKAGAVPAGARLGALNDGLVAYYFPGGSLDLDGVVDPQVISAIEEHGMCQFARDHHVDWVLDDPGAVKRLLALGPGLSIQPVQILPAQGHVVGERQILVELSTDDCR